MLMVLKLRSSLIFKTLKMKHRGFIINVKDRRDRRVFSRYGHGLSLMLAVFNCKFTPIIYMSTEK